MIKSDEWKTLFCLVSDELVAIERREEELNRVPLDDTEYLNSLRLLTVLYDRYKILRDKIWDEYDLALTIELGGRKNG